VDYGGDGGDVGMVIVIMAVIIYLAVFTFHLKQGE
jgi:hypothetical protein